MIAGHQWKLPALEPEKGGLTQRTTTASRPRALPWWGASPGGGSGGNSGNEGRLPSLSAGATSRLNFRRSFLRDRVYDRIQDPQELVPPPHRSSRLPSGCGQVRVTRGPPH